MRIALLTAEYPPQPGGIGDYTRLLAHALAAHGAHTSVLTSAHPAAGTYPDEPGLPVFRTVRTWDWRCWRAVIAELDRLRPDVLHIQYQTGAYGMHPAITLLPRRLRSLPGRPRVVVTLHDTLEPYLFPKAGLLRRWVTLRLAADADALIVTNAADAHNLRHPPRPLRAWGMRLLDQVAQAPPCNLHPYTIPIGSNIPLAPPPGATRAAWRARLGVGETETLVAYFGLCTHSKGVDLLLDALADSSLRVLLVGGAAPTPRDQTFAAAVQARIARAGMHGRVQQTGHVAAAEVSAHLLAADIIALPFRAGVSFRSGSLLAALSHGKAVVTTLPPDEPAPLTDGTHALLVPPNNAPALAAALHRLAGDAALRTHLEHGARTLAASFRWEAIAAQHAQVYAALGFA